MVAAYDAEIAEVERTRHDLDQHLPIGGLGIGALDFDQGVDAGTAFCSSTKNNIFVTAVTS